MHLKTAATYKSHLVCNCCVQMTENIILCPGLGVPMVSLIAVLCSLVGLIAGFVARPFLNSHVINVLFLILLALVILLLLLLLMMATIINNIIS